MYRILGFLLVYATVSGFVYAGTFDKHPTVKIFIKDMQKYSFTEEQLLQIFKKTTYQPHIVSLMSNKTEGLPWYRYQKLFVNKYLISKGVDYWKKNETTLKKVQDIYGIPPEIIVSIIGVESKYGKARFHYKVMDALTTLAFYSPVSREYFRDELQDYLLLTKESKLDPLKIKGSYAGAMGKPQFMPSSYREYGVDFDQDGKIDLLSSDADTIASIANYFKKHGWQKDQKIVVPVTTKGIFYKKLFAKSQLEPNIKAVRLYFYGVYPIEKIPLRTKVRTIVLQNYAGEEYWVGLQNFYVITLYNRSTVYGMAVFKLAEEIKKEYQINQYKHQLCH